ncbi:MAG: PadR family transcriptional regulator [Chloroflexota bacterium]
MDRELLLLGLLHQGQMHGYKLNEFIDKTLHLCTDLKRSTAYFLLDKLAKEGYVQVATEREGHYPERRVYALNPAGEERFFALLRENLGGYEMVRYPGDVGLAFLHELPAGERVALLRERRQRVGEALDHLRGVESGEGSLGLVIERNIVLLEAEYAWLEGALARAPLVEALRPEGAEDRPDAAK